MHRAILTFTFLIGTLFAVEFRPVPWLTNDAVTFLESFLKKHPKAKVLEFGSGSSTIWFVKKGCNLVSVEHDVNWYKEVKAKLKEIPHRNRVSLHLKKRPYYTFCEELDSGSFDLILVDGRNRKGCIRDSISLLKRGGIMMVDNAERSYYKKALDLMKGWECVKTYQPQPDSCGFTYPNWQTHWFIKP